MSLENRPFGKPPITIAQRQSLDTFFETRSCAVVGIPRLESPIDLSAHTISFIKYSKETSSSSSKSLQSSFGLLITLSLNSFIINPSKRKYDLGNLTLSSIKITLRLVV